MGQVNHRYKIFNLYLYLWKYILVYYSWIYYNTYMHIIMCINCSQYVTVRYRYNILLTVILLISA